MNNDADEFDIAALAEFKKELVALAVRYKLRLVRFNLYEDLFDDEVEIKFAYQRPVTYEGERRQKRFFAGLIGTHSIALMYLNAVCGTVSPKGIDKVVCSTQFGTGRGATSLSGRHL